MMSDARMARMILDLRREGITDAHLLNAIERVPRDLFVPAAFNDQAFANRALPIGFGQTVSQPLVVALMTQALELTDRVKILEIGTGSGYQAAVLAHLVRRVYSIERHRELLKEAEARFKVLGLHTITTKQGDGSKGWPAQAPFDRIIVTAAAEAMPEGLAAQLAPGGIMVAPVGLQGQDQTLYRIRRTEDGFKTESLGLTRFVPLVVEDEVPARPMRRPAS
ncbi:MAG: protein-L-isoaspartate(D-aspartate) O-methyltransferase [Alphaproteobacteria bacterium]